MTMAEAPTQGQLPLEVRLQLVKAAAIKHPLQRLAAIEQIQASARAQYPHLFQAVGPSE